MENSPFPRAQLSWLHFFAYRFSENEIVNSETADKSWLLEIYIYIYIYIYITVAIVISLLQCGRFDLTNILRIWSCVVTLQTVRFSRDVANLKLCFYCTGGLICKALCESEVVLLQCGRLNLQEQLRIWSRHVIKSRTIWFVRYFVNLNLRRPGTADNSIHKCLYESPVAVTSRTNLQLPSHRASFHSCNKAVDVKLWFRSTFTDWMHADCHSAGINGKPIFETKHYCTS